MALAGEPQNPDPGLFRGSRPVPKERSTSHDRCGSRAIYLYILYSTAVAQLASLSEQNKEAREKNERRGEEEEKKNQIKMRDMCKVAPRVLIGDPRAGPSVFVFFFFFPDSFLFTKKNKSLFFNNVKLENVFLFLKNPTGGDKEKCGLKRKICSALLNRTVEGIYRFFLLLTGESQWCQWVWKCQWTSGKDTCATASNRTEAAIDQKKRPAETSSHYVKRPIRAKRHFDLKQPTDSEEEKWPFSDAAQRCNWSGWSLWWRRPSRPTRPRRPVPSGAVKWNRRR